MATATQTRPPAKLPSATSTQSSWTIRDHAGRDHVVVVSSVESEQPSTSVFWREVNGLGEEIATVRSASHDEAAAEAGRELDRLAGVPVPTGSEVVWLRPTSQHSSGYATLVLSDGTDPALTPEEWRWLGGSIAALVGIISRGSVAPQIRQVHGGGPYADEVEHVLTWADGSEDGARVLVSRAGYNTKGVMTYTVDALQPLRPAEWLALARYLGGRL